MKNFEELEDLRSLIKIISSKMEDVLDTIVEHGNGWFTKTKMPPSSEMFKARDLINSYFEKLDDVFKEEKKAYAEIEKRHHD